MAYTPAVVNGMDAAMKKLHHHKEGHRKEGMQHQGHAPQAPAMTEEETGMKALADRGNEALAGLTPEVRALLEKQAAHVVTVMMNNPANRQANAEAGISPNDTHEAAKTMVAIFAGTATATADHKLSPEELAAAVTSQISGELSQQQYAMPQPQQYAPQQDEPDSQRRKPAEISKRTLVSIITGAIGAAAGWFAAHVYSQDKMLEFDVAHKKKAQDIITGKGGLGASIADASGGVAGHPGFLGLGNNLAAGTSSHLIESLAHDQLILENPCGKYSFAKWMRRIGGTGTFNMGVGLATGAAVGLATYAMMKPDKDKDWASRVESDKDRDISRG